MMITGNETGILLDLLGFAPEEDFSKLCPSLEYEYRYSADENCNWPHLTCEALAKASNFLWEQEFGVEFSDPERFGASNEPLQPLPLPKRDYIPMPF